MCIDAELLAKEITELVQRRIKACEVDKYGIEYSDAVNALSEIKAAVNRIRPDLETVLEIKWILDKYKIEPINQFYFLDRAEMDTSCE